LSADTRLVRLTILGLAAAVWLACQAAPAEAGDRRRVPNRLTVMTWNCEFLWDGLPPEQGIATFDHKGSPEKAAEHMRRLAEVIRRENPDILNLVEVENLQSVELMNRKYLQGMGYKAYLVEGKDHELGQDVGLLTRVDPVDGRLHYDGRIGRTDEFAYYVTKNYVARFDIGGLKLGMIGLHLRSNPGSAQRKLIREAQAEAVAGMALDLKREGRSVIVLGDLNDLDGADDARDHTDARPITNVLARIRAFDPASPASDLVNAASLMPKSERYTCFWDANHNQTIDGPKELSQIDHILMSPELAARVVLAKIPHEHDPRQITDHYPVVVRLRMPRER
jgi:endonuclease/exonuclease/phosphatase family metal-dependent hydrolase